MDLSKPPLGAARSPLAGADPLCMEDRTDTELATIRAHATEVLASRRHAAAATALRGHLQPPNPSQTDLVRALVQPDRAGHIVLHYDGGSVQALTLSRDLTAPLDDAIADLIQLGAQKIAGRVVINMSAGEPVKGLACAVCDATPCGAPDELPDGRCAACEVHLHREHRLLGVTCTEFIPF